MTQLEHLDRWVKGESVHRPIVAMIKHAKGLPLVPTPVQECCPDFSCCYPDMLMPLEERIKYRNEWIAKQVRYAFEQKPAV